MRPVCRKCLRHLRAGALQRWSKRGGFHQHGGCPGGAGTSVGVLADSLEKAVRRMQSALERGDLCLVTPYSPDAGFSVGNAMGRNRLIYTLADYAIIVASDAESGGTWAGAVETLRNGWIPIFVLEHARMPEGNRLLIQKGAHPFPHPYTGSPLKLADWLREKAVTKPETPAQPSLL